MHQISIKKIIICLVSIFIIVTCTSCKADEPYYVSDFLNYLANKSGIGDSDNINDNFISLKNWNIVDIDDIYQINNELEYSYLVKTISNLLEDDNFSIDTLSNEEWINKNIRENNKVGKETAMNIVDKAVEIINNKSFDEHYEFKYIQEPKTNNDDLKENDLFYDEEENSFKIVTKVDEQEYDYRDAEFDEVFSDIDISGSYDIDFSDAEVTPLQDEYTNTSYINNKYNLLASKNHVFEKDGFRISYSLSTSGIDVHVSRKVDKTTIYADASINKIKPTFKWVSTNGDLRNCYFNVTMDSTTSLGATIGKYGNYYLKLKELDSTSFVSTIKSMIVPRSDEVEAVIPICEIKTPIASIPFLYLNLTVGIKLYVSGKVEIIMYNSHSAGFEIKNGKARFFYDHDDDLDTIIQASAKAALAVNLGLDAAKYRLCDIELDGGIKTQLKATMHLYDSDFNETELSSDIAYSTLQEVSKDNPYVAICGDISLYWLLDLICNTSKSVLNKMGFTKTFHILDDDNQIFGNLHHLENGQFVKKCTKKTKTAIKNESLNINSANKILLNSYAEVLNINESFIIIIQGLPAGYNSNDIRYSSSDNSIATVNDGRIVAFKPGSTKINVHTSDNKYNTYINVLVSTQ